MATHHPDHQHPRQHQHDCDLDHDRDREHQHQQSNNKSQARCRLLVCLSEELILCIGHHLAANSYLADLVAAARTCRELHRILIGLAYLEAIERDSALALRLPPPASPSKQQTRPVPVALWAAGRNRVDTLARLWLAQAHPRTRFQAVTAAYWIPRGRAAGHLACAPASVSTGARRRGDDDDEGHDETLALAASTSANDNTSTNAATSSSPSSSTGRGRVRGWGWGWCTALHVAAREGADDAVRALFGYGAVVDATARHVCMCNSRHMRLIYQEQRIRIGIGMTEEGSAGEDEEEDEEEESTPVATPLHVALANRQEGTARLLVRMGADWGGEVVFHCGLPVYGRGKGVGVEGGGDDAPSDGNEGDEEATPLWDDPHNHTFINGSRSRARDFLALPFGSGSGSDSNSNRSRYRHHHDHQQWGPEDQQRKATATETPPHTTVVIPRILFHTHPALAASAREEVSNSRHGQRREAALASSLGSSHGATGLRIAAANGMLSFLAWLARSRSRCRHRLVSGTVGDVGGGPSLSLSPGLGSGSGEGEFFDAEASDDMRFGALHFAALAGVDCPPRWAAGDLGPATREGIPALSQLYFGAQYVLNSGGGDDDDDHNPNPNGNGSGNYTSQSNEVHDGGDHTGRGIVADQRSAEAEEKAGKKRKKKKHEQEQVKQQQRKEDEEKARMEALVSVLVVLGAAWEDEQPDIQDDVVRHARQWRNDALADVLEARRGRPVGPGRVVMR